MTNQSDFGVPLGRLLDHRKLDAGSVAPRAGIAESGLRAVLGGAAPEPELLRALAPALGLQTVDLFALAGVPLPEDLAPLDARAGRLVPHLVQFAVSLPPERRAQLLEHARSLPQERRTAPVPEHPPFERYEPSFGAALLHMLAGRNLGRVHSAKVLYWVTGLYVSAATIGGVGRGVVEVTRDLLADFAIVLGIPADELLAMAGPVRDSNDQLGTRIQWLHSAGLDTAELILELRRLTADQIRNLGAEAGAGPW